MVLDLRLIKIGSLGRFPFFILFEKGYFRIFVWFFDDAEKTRCFSLYCIFSRDACPVCAAPVRAEARHVPYLYRGSLRAGVYLRAALHGAREGMIRPQRPAGTEISGVRYVKK